MRRFVGHEHASIRVGGDDSGRTALYQHFQLFFGLAARIPLSLNLMKMLDDYLAVPVHFVNEESHAEKSGKIKDIAGHSYSEVPDKLIKDLRKERAKRCDSGDLPRTQDSAHHRHGQQIEEPERQITS